MFDASVFDNFFEDGDEESYRVLKLCNISDVLEENKEEVDDELRISQGLT